MSAASKASAQSKKSTDEDKQKRKSANAEEVNNTDQRKSANAEEANNTDRPVLEKKFSLGGDAWNKKSTARKKLNSGIKSEFDPIEDDEDEGRWVCLLINCIQLDGVIVDYMLRSLQLSIKVSTVNQWLFSGSFDALLGRHDNNCYNI